MIRVRLVGQEDYSKNFVKMNIYKMPRMLEKYYIDHFAKRS